MRPPCPCQGEVAEARAAAAPVPRGDRHDRCIPALAWDGGLVRSVQPAGLLKHALETQPSTARRAAEKDEEGVCRGAGRGGGFATAQADLGSEGKKNWQGRPWISGCLSQVEAAQARLHWNNVAQNFERPSPRRKGEREYDQALAALQERVVPTPDRITEE